jgi:hypothetical protein
VQVATTATYQRFVNVLDYNFELRLVVMSSGESDLDQHMVYPAGEDPECPN